jgi:hypothetical protein
MDSPFASIVPVSKRQLGLITREQLHDAGVSVQQLRTLVNQGTLARIRPRVYEVCGMPPSWEHGLLAALLSAGDGATASHAAAVRLWQCAHRLGDRYELTVPDERRPRLVGVWQHRSTRLRDVDVVVVNGIARTSFERTICDCTTRLSQYQLGRVLDDELRRGLASLARLADCAEALESGPGRHMSVVRSLLSTRDATFNPGGSGAELDLLDIFRRAGFPTPVQQFRVKLQGKSFFLDYAWPPWRIFAEYYGLAWHVGASSVVHDNDRLTELASRGWLPLIFTEEATEKQIVERTADAFRERGVRTLSVA